MDILYIIEKYQLCGISFVFNICSKTTQGGIRGKWKTAHFGAGKHYQKFNKVRFVELEFYDEIWAYLAHIRWTIYDLLKKCHNCGKRFQNTCLCRILYLMDRVVYGEMMKQLISGRKITMWNNGKCVLSSLILFDELSISMVHFIILSFQ